ncbi:hypothetical protein APY04_0846 [Hyphomicrobium sulfonivorans]|uniref:Uncharacterized protein n=1 Tax=Hyphomicrobium sulfonivorans TaxID=121290 RepID=A0A125NVS9_HYPSL|nr:hypothetical protein [Hyphomicrobium sulfonivorans]KWT70785.1 hypothetical protein APY04_0846 [Hyphomicrobium sulfonivorans]
MPQSVSFEDYIRTQTESRAEVSMKLGAAADGSGASIMTYSDKTPGAYFWSVSGSEITMIAFLGDDD